MAYWLVILALILLVVVHELGHFLAARAVGVRATKFYIFFPPAVFKRQVGEVEYGIGAIPLGGFVKLPGMFEPVPTEVGERMEWDVERLLDECTEAGAELDREEGAGSELWSAAQAVGAARGETDLAARLQLLDDEVVAFGSGPVLAGARGDRRRHLVKRIRSLRGRIENLIDDCHPKAYWRASLWRRMTVIFAGPLVNVVVAFVVLAGFFWLHVPTYEITGPLQLEKVQSGGAADRVGITSESKVTWWNGPIEGSPPRDVRERIATSTGKPVDLKWIDKNGARRESTVFPTYDKGELRLGVILPGPTSKKALAFRVTGSERTTLEFGVRTALVEMREITWGNITRLPQVFFNKEIREEVSSVVGIVQVAQDVDRAGQFWHYVGVISLVLAVMNLLPLLPLDGGHLFFGVLEFLRRGRPMPRASFERFSAVGFGLVLMLFFIGLNNDLG